MILSKQVETKCHLNFTMFPFDEQNCSFTMALENNANLQVTVLLNRYGNGYMKSDV